jgi:hypothetical protein
MQQHLGVVIKLDEEDAPPSNKNVTHYNEEYRIRTEPIK